jgi:hypothetical protein
MKLRRLFLSPLCLLVAVSFGGSISLAQQLLVVPRMDGPPPRSRVAIVRTSLLEMTSASLRFPETRWSLTLQGRVLQNWLKQPKTSRFKLVQA